MMAAADPSSSGQALDALLENAVRHAGTDDVIQLSVIRRWPGMQESKGSARR